MCIKLLLCHHLPVPLRLRCWGGYYMCCNDLLGVLDLTMMFPQSHGHPTTSGQNKGSNVGHWGAGDWANHSTYANLSYRSLRRITTHCKVGPIIWCYTTARNPGFHLPFKPFWIPGTFNLISLLFYRAQLNLLPLEDLFWALTAF